MIDFSLKKSKNFPFNLIKCLDNMTKTLTPRNVFLLVYVKITFLTFMLVKGKEIFQI